MRTKWLFLLLATLLLLSSCSRKKMEPRRQLSEEKMVEMLVDVHLAEAALLISQYEGRNTDSLSVELYARLFNKHGVSRDRYERSLLEYQEDPVLMEKIYEQVYSRLSTIQTEFRTRHNIEEVPYE